MEVCVDSLESVINAYEGKADRVELCSSLDEGGLTPSYGLFKCVRKFLANNTNREFKVNCMVRCRSGDFNYTDTEIDTMIEDINKFVELEADGLVFGALDQEGNVDESLMREFLKLVPSGVSTTFHRAFDVCSNWQDSFDKIQSLGFKKLLTSGQEKSAFLGKDLIAKLVATSNSVTIIPGCGINASNLEQILSHAKCTEFHASCRVSRPSKMIFRSESIKMGNENSDEFIIKYTDKNKVQQLSDIFKNFKSS